MALRNLCFTLIHARHFVVIETYVYGWGVTCRSSVTHTRMCNVGVVLARYVVQDSVTTRGTKGYITDVHHASRICVLLH